MKKEYVTVEVVPTKPMATFATVTVIPTKPGATFVDVKWAGSSRRKVKKTKSGGKSGRKS